jgi:hypothetical protein
MAWLPRVFSLAGIWPWPLSMGAGEVLAIRMVAALGCSLVYPTRADLWSLTGSGARFSHESGFDAPTADGSDSKEN